MTNFPDNGLPEDFREAMVKQEQEKKVKQILQETTRGAFRELASRGPNACTPEHIGVAQKLVEAVREKDYPAILRILDKATLPAGTSLEVRECRETSFGDQSDLFIPLPDGRRDMDIFATLRFEDSPMGAWQAFLLHQMWHYLPLWWHSNYARRDYIYSKEDLKGTILGRSIEDSGVRRYMNLMGCRVASLNPDALALTPEIYFENGKYYITCCFWSDFGGLKREYALITLTDGRMEGFEIFDEKVLFAYDCGILF